MALGVTCVRPLAEAAMKTIVEVRPAGRSARPASSEGAGAEVPIEQSWGARGVDVAQTDAESIKDRLADFQAYIHVRARRGRGLVGGVSGI